MEVGKGEEKGTRKIGVHQEVECFLDRSPHALGVPVSKGLNLDSITGKLRGLQQLIKLFWISVSTCLIMRIIVFTMNYMKIK